MRAFLLARERHRSSVVFVMPANATRRRAHGMRCGSRAIGPVLRCRRTVLRLWTELRLRTVRGRRGRMKRRCCAVDRLLRRLEGIHARRLGGTIRRRDTSDAVRTMKVAVVATGARHVRRIRMRREICRTQGHAVVRLHGLRCVHHAIGAGQVSRPESPSVRSRVRIRECRTAWGRVWSKVRRMQRHALVRLRDPRIMHVGRPLPHGRD